MRKIIIITGTAITIIVVTFLIYIRTNNTRGKESHLIPINENEKSKVYHVPFYRGNQIYEYYAMKNDTKYLSEFKDRCPTKHEIKYFTQYFNKYKILLNKSSTDLFTNNDSPSIPTFIGYLCDINKRCDELNDDVDIFLNDIYQSFDEDTKKEKRISLFTVYLTQYNCFELMNEKYIEKAVESKYEWPRLMNTYCHPILTFYLPVLQKMQQAKNLDSRKLQDIETCIQVIENKDNKYQEPIIIDWQYKPK